MSRLVPPALEAAAVEVEAGILHVRETHRITAPACQGYHPIFAHRSVRGMRHALATVMALMDDGGIIPLCDRCAYGFNGSDVVARRRLVRPAVSAGGATVGNRPDVATPRVAKATRGAKGAR